MLLIWEHAIPQLLYLPTIRFSVSLIQLVQLPSYLPLLLTILEISIVDLLRKQTVVRRIVKSIEKSSISEDVKSKMSQTTERVVGRSSYLENQMLNLRRMTVIPNWRLSNWMV